MGNADAARAGRLSCVRSLTCAQRGERGEGPVRPQGARDRRERSDLVLRGISGKRAEALAFSTKGALS